jgi:hypothetical protein
VYSPFAEIVPIDEFPPATPFTLHVTPVFVLPVTTAVYCDDVPSVTVVGPSTASVTLDPLSAGSGDGAASVTGRLFETVGLAALVAVMVTVADWGAEPGAL